MRYLHEFISLELDADKCRGCRTCVRVCPQGVFGFADRRAFIRDRKACMECGACALNCRFKAIKAGRGVGCAAAIINGLIKGGEPSCDCGGSPARGTGKGPSKNACC
jgi:NAD-dependent dihydropyrimidine dehydrogenase PreA subunit